MISKVLIIADTTKQSSISVLDAFRMIRNDQQSVKAIFASYLSDLFKKSLGPNTLTHWAREEEDSLERVRNYFARMEIPYHFKIIAVPPLGMIFEEMGEGVYDLILLQSGLLKKWRKKGANCALCSDALSKSRCPILVINSSEDKDEMGSAIQGEDAR